MPAVWEVSGIRQAARPEGDQGPLGLAEGATENTSVVTELLAGLGERGLDTTGPILVVTDGAKALRGAVPRSSTIPSCNP